MINIDFQSGLVIHPLHLIHIKMNIKAHELTINEPSINSQKTIHLIMIYLMENKLLRCWYHFLRNPGQHVSKSVHLIFR